MILFSILTAMPKSRLKYYMCTLCNGNRSYISSFSPFIKERIGSMKFNGLNWKIYNNFHCKDDVWMVERKFGKQSLLEYYSTQSLRKSSILKVTVCNEILLFSNSAERGESTVHFNLHSKNFRRGNIDIGEPWR